jgi:hypothetical protein
VTINLKSNIAHSTSSFSSAGHLLASSTTNSDGSFTLKSKASKESFYYIQIQSSNNGIFLYGTDTSFSSKIKIVDIGNLYSGTH